MAPAHRSSLCTAAHCSAHGTSPLQQPGWLAAPGCICLWPQCFCPLHAWPLHAFQHSCAMYVAACRVILPVKQRGLRNHAAGFSFTASEWPAHVSTQVPSPIQPCIRQRAGAAKEGAKGYRAPLTHTSPHAPARSYPLHPVTPLNPLPAPNCHPHCLLQAPTAQAGTDLSLKLSPGLLGAPGAGVLQGPGKQGSAGRRRGAQGCRDLQASDSDATLVSWGGVSLSGVALWLRSEQSGSISETLKESLSGGMIYNAVQPTHPMAPMCPAQKCQQLRQRKFSDTARVVLRPVNQEEQMATRAHQEMWVVSVVMRLEIHVTGVNGCSVALIA